MRTLSKILKLILKLEHSIYCTTNCTIELPLHKRYYQHRREVYENYLMEKPIDIL